MNTNKRKLNDNKTEAMLILSSNMSIHSSLPSVVHIGNPDVLFVPYVKKLGVTLDQHLSSHYT